MPRRDDIRTILIPGSGPITIGQGCEFDYSGVQACKVLRGLGYRVVLVNSNPATIMTDPSLADATYVEPLHPALVESIIAIERPDAILPTVGGQAGLNLAVQLAERGALERHGVELIGARLASIRMAEDRRLFREAMIAAGIPVPPSVTCGTVAEALAAAESIGYPLLVRASFTLGGAGGGVAHDRDELARVAAHGLRQSPVTEILVERNLTGWKEFELEVMRDCAGRFVTVCTIENLDPMGVHTGDSVTVAPAMTLTDKEQQHLRDLARRVLAAVGVETGGSNVQFAVHPRNGEVFVIEMNPRVSRSSALASKATGVPIAKLAAQLAVGLTLDEIANDITGATPASFEPSLDYCVVKIPRWNFEKFPEVDQTLGPQMKSVGEVMAIGRTFPEALNKALRGLDTGLDGFGGALADLAAGTDPDLLRRPTAQRLAQLAHFLRARADEPDAVHAAARLSGYDPWFTAQLRLILAVEAEVAAAPELDAALLRRAKQHGLSDRAIARLGHGDEAAVRRARLALDVRPRYYRVDTCAGEFAAETPYLYAHYETGDEAPPTARPKVMVLGSGPNRIGQGIEFDACCVQACWALAELGYETIMVNCNPETVSTDYDTADRLYFEPLTHEDVLAIVERERPDGVVVQFGGQTPINLARGLADAGVPIWGTPVDSLDLAEDRGRFGALLRELEVDHPRWGLAHTREEARRIADAIGYPVLVRPSRVLGGRAMAVAYDQDQLDHHLDRAADISGGAPVLVDQYIEDAYEVDVDAVGDGHDVVIAGVMQHIEEAGVHSGDSACVLPPYKVSFYHLGLIREATERLGRALRVKGLMNLQFAVKDDDVFVLEVNPRASRTVPFVSKATGVEVARLAAKVQAGRSLRELGFTESPRIDGFFVKEKVMPFDRLPGADPRLGPEMRSTGEVMGHASRFGHAVAKAMMAAGNRLPEEGAVLITVNHLDKSGGIRIARDLHRLGFAVYATHGTAEAIRTANVPVTEVAKAGGEGTTTVDLIVEGKVHLVINTPLGQQARADQQAMYAAAIAHKVPLITTLSAARAAVGGIKALRTRALRVRALQTHHGLRAREAGA
ncbi:MAG: carbamoyl-phosphate synthase large subunit [Candidatus Krumholzibacteriia bacterium]